MVDEELWHGHAQRLLHQDEVVVGDGEGVVVARTHFPLARDRRHHGRLLERVQDLSCLGEGGPGVESRAEKEVRLAHMYLDAYDNTRVLRHTHKLAS